MMFQDSMRDDARAERVLRTLRQWGQGVALPPLAVFGHQVGLNRGASGPVEVERRLRVVLDRLVAERRLHLRLHPPGARPCGWMVQLAETGRILHSRHVPAHWFDLSAVRA